MSILVVLLGAAVSLAAQTSAPAATVDRIVQQGSTALAAGRLVEAESAFNHALLLSPGNRDAQIQLGIVYLVTERFVQARLLFRSAAETHPDDAAMNLRIGAAYVQASQLTEAERHERHGRLFGWHGRPRRPSASGAGNP